MANDELLIAIRQQLELITAMLRVAYADRIEDLKKGIEQDPVATAILEKSELDLSSGELVAEVVKVVPQKERTIQARLSELIRSGVLKSVKAGKKSYFQRTGLV